MKTKEEIEKQIDYLHKQEKQIKILARGRASLFNKNINEVYTQQDLLALEDLNGRISMLLWVLNP